jgi:hypothetical protein
MTLKRLSFGTAFSIACDLYGVVKLIILKVYLIKEIKGGMYYEYLYC